MPDGKTLHKSGYKFVGWSEDKKTYMHGGSTYKPTKDVTLYAIWKEEILANLVVTENKFTEGTKIALGGEARAKENNVERDVQSLGGVVATITSVLIREQLEDIGINRDYITNTGGIEGHLDGFSKSYVLDCYNTGDISSQYRKAGGLIGEILSEASVQVARCYSAGCSVSASMYAGELVGSCCNSEGFDCYCLYDLAVGYWGNDNTATRGDASISTSALKEVPSRLGSDFIKSPNDNINKGFPILEWQ